MALKRVTAPAERPVTLIEAKRLLVVEHDNHDDLIESFIDAGVETLDGPRGWLGRALIDQTWDLYLAGFPACGKPIELPLPPLIEVVEIFYANGSGVQTELTSDLYVVAHGGDQPSRIALPANGTWPTAQCVAHAVRIRFRCGYLDDTVSPAVAAVPSPIKTAILLYVGNLYRNRTTYVVGQPAATLPWAAEQLLRSHRVYLGMA